MVQIMKAAAAGDTSPAKLKEIAFIAAQQVKLEDELAALTVKMTDKARELTKMKTVTLPLAMQAARLKGIQLEDGSKVEIENFVTGNIKEENRTDAFAWLRKNNFGSLIKRKIAMNFGMGEDNSAKAVAAALKKMRIPFESDETVHAGTLRSFVRERLSEGKALPPSIDVATVPTATIKRSK